MILLQLCIHRTRIAQQRKKNKSAISLSKTFKRQAFIKDRKLRLTSTTDPHGRKSTSPIDFSLPPRSPPSTSSAASGSVVVNDAVTKQTVVRVGGQVVTLSADLGLEQAVEGVSIETAGSASDASDDDNSVHTAADNLSEGDDSDKGEQGNEAAAPFEQRVDGKTTRDSSPPAAAPALDLGAMAQRPLTQLHPEAVLQVKVGTTYRHLEMLMLLLLLKMAAVARDG